MNQPVKVVIYHNPRCSKSRQTLDLLRDRGIEPEIVEYLRTPPDTQTLAKILTLLGIGARELIREHEAPYAESGLDDPQLDEAAILQCMIRHPILIQRPIVIANDKAAIGRPPESVLEIL